MSIQNSIHMMARDFVTCPESERAASKEDLLNYLDFLGLLRGEIQWAIRRVTDLRALREMGRISKLELGEALDDFAVSLNPELD
jgi:hypothetical protein